MRKLLSIFAIFSTLALVVSCEKADDSDSAFTDYDKGKLEQEIFADETVGKGAFAFTAAEPWSVSIGGAVKSSSWVTVKPMNGDAGKSEINITLEVNTSGEDREETININAGESIITIIVSQKAVTQTGGKPAPSVITSVRIEPSVLSLFVGEKRLFTAVVDPKDAPDIGVLWSSSKPELISIDATGNATVIAAGTAIITATSKLDPSKKGTCEVTIVDSPNLISEQYIPDPIFRAWINKKLTQETGIYTVAQAEKLTELTITNTNIASLVGIEYFKNLEKLHCNSNQLTSLDLSKLSNLQDLECKNNKLTSLNVNDTRVYRLVCDDNKLETISMNGGDGKIIRVLSCDNNLLAELDLTSYDYIDALDCSNNLITNLSFKEIKKTLKCSNNKLETLDLTKVNKDCKNLECASNKLTGLDLSRFVILDILRCSDNLFQTLDVSNNVKLRILDCSKNELRTLDVSTLPDLYSLTCSSTLLTQLDISNNFVLNTLFADPNEHLTRIKVWSSFDIGDPPVNYHEPVTAIYVTSF